MGLRQQVNARIQRKPLPRLDPEERILWVALRRTWSRWQDALLLVRPETVLAWHRNAYRRHWTARSRAPGRARLNAGVRTRIVQMACENPTRGAPRIQSELLKLGFNVSERTVSRSLPRIRPGRGAIHEWGTFLGNHREARAAMDFFMVPTVTFRVLTVWFLIQHGRRKIVHFDITEHPTAPWMIQELCESFPYDSVPSYLVFAPALAALGVRRLDLLVVTHGDLDHRGGAPAVIDRIPVGEIWLPHGASGDPAFEALRAAATRRRVPVFERGPGDAPLRAGDLEVRAVWPARDGKPLLRCVAPA